MLLGADFDFLKINFSSNTKEFHFTIGELNISDPNYMELSEFLANFFMKIVKINKEG